MAQHFHPLQVRSVSRETADCISVEFAMPDDLVPMFRYRAGQYLTLRAEVGDRELRRSYSLCSAPHEGTWRVAIKRVDEGQFSQWAHALLRPGEVIDVLPPDGKFVLLPEPNSNRIRHVLLLAAGSGITPIMAILKTLLECESQSTVTLVYGNSRVKDIIFKEAIEDLRDRFLTRFQLLHVLSREVQEAPVTNGRLDGSKVAALFANVIDASQVDEVFICGPYGMIESCAAACEHAGIQSAHVHKELFGVPDVLRTVADIEPKTGQGDTARVEVIADGIERVLHVGYRGDSVLESALAVGIDVPYACKAGVCCTCRAQVLEGEVRMDANFTLEQHELDRGFVLTCQSHPVTDRVRISFDAR